MSGQLANFGVLINNHQVLPSGLLLMYYSSLSDFSLCDSCSVVNVEMGDIHDDEVPCCGKDVRREDESLF